MVPGISGMSQTKSYIINTELNFLCGISEILFLDQAGTLVKYLASKFCLMVGY